MKKNREMTAIANVISGGPGTKVKLTYTSEAEAKKHFKKMTDLLASVPEFLKPKNT